MVVVDDLFLERIAAALLRLYHFNDLGKCPAFPCLQCCNCLLGHDCLFYLFMDRHLLKDGVVFLQFDPVGCVLPVLGGNVPRGAALPAVLVLCTLEDNLNPISFSRHLTASKFRSANVGQIYDAPNMLFR